MKVDSRGSASTAREQTLSRGTSSFFHGPNLLFPSTPSLPKRYPRRRNNGGSDSYIIRSFPSSTLSWTPPGLVEHQQHQSFSAFPFTRSSVTPSRLLLGSNSTSFAPFQQRVPFHVVPTTPTSSPVIFPWTSQFALRHPNFDHSFHSNAYRQYTVLCPVPLETGRPALTGQSKSRSDSGTLYILSLVPLNWEAFGIPEGLVAVDPAH